MGKEEEICGGPENRGRGGGGGGELETLIRLGCRRRIEMED